MFIDINNLRRLIREVSDDIETKRFKYPRTFHLPWSLGQSNDDKTFDQEAIDNMFNGVNVVVTEKLDGENTTIYADGLCHARSIDSARASHKSRDYVKSIAGSVGCQLPTGWRLMGENLYAQHSIPYDKLSDYFMVFNIVDEHDVALAWDDMEDVASSLGLKTVPVIFRGTWDEETIRDLFPFKSSFGSDAEGYVVRDSGSWPMSDFMNRAAKFVRKGHVQTDDHWMSKDIVPNKRLSSH